MVGWQPHGCGGPVHHIGPPGWSTRLRDPGLPADPCRLAPAAGYERILPAAVAGRAGSQAPGGKARNSASISLTARCRLHSMRRPLGPGLPDGDSGPNCGEDHKEPGRETGQERPGKPATIRRVQGGGPLVAPWLFCVCKRAVCWHGRLSGSFGSAVCKPAVCEQAESVLRFKVGANAGGVRCGETGLK